MAKPSSKHTCTCVVQLYMYIHVCICVYMYMYVQDCLKHTPLQYVQCTCMYTYILHCFISLHSKGEERFYGIACECDNTVCPRGIDNEICSGSMRGECTCEGCQCARESVTGEFYMRSDCSCTPNNATCFDPQNITVSTVLIHTCA